MKGGVGGTPKPPAGRPLHPLVWGGKGILGGTPLLPAQGERGSHGAYQVAGAVANFFYAVGFEFGEGVFVQEPGLVESFYGDGPAGAACGVAVEDFEGKAQGGLLAVGGDAGGAVD